MSMFNMGGGIQTASISTSVSNYLKAGIHEVVFKGIEPVEGADAFIIKFETPDGLMIHNERMFAPRSTERPENNGIPSPSEIENFLVKCKLLIKALDPELFEKIEKDGSKFAAPDFDGFVKLLKKYLDKKVDTVTHIKLLPTKGTFVGFPYSVARINKEGVLYINNNFIGDDLTLTAYETKRIEDAANAKPTDMSKRSSSVDIDSIKDEFPDVDTADEDDDDGLPF